MSIPSYARHLLQAAVLTFTPALCAQAATVLPDEYDRMQEQALRQGHVPVHVVLTNTAPQEALKNPEGFAAATRNQANSLLVELGDQAHTYGLRISPLGSMDVWVSAHGLQTLNSSRTAISLSPGPQWYHHTLLSDSDGSLSAIDALLEKQDGFAEVEVTLYVEGTGFNIDSVSGRGALRIATAAQEQEATERAQQVLAHLGLDFASPPGLSNPTGTASLIDAGAVKRTGALALKTHRLALASLANHPAVRAIKPVGYTDPRPAWIDPDALREAARSGSAEVLVQLRSPFVGGPLSPSTYQAQMQSNQRMLDELLAPYKPLRKPQSFALLGAASAVLSQPDLERLATNRDARLQGLLVNKSMYKPSLATSTATMNLPPYWSSGYTGAGQTIVIVDTGIEKAHAMLKSAGGTSRVTFEACYQTDTVLDGKTYHSDCPGKNTHGDSPPGLTGSGERLYAVLCGT